jgi:hypothetical protein
MRHLLLVLAALAGCVVADEPDRKHSLSLDVKVVRSGATSDSSRSAHVDQVDRYRSRKTVVFQRNQSGVLDLAIAVRNFLRTPDSVKVDWLFFAQDVQSSKLLAHSRDEIEILLRPGEERKLTAAAEPAQRTEGKRWEFERVVTPEKRTELPVSHEKANAGRKIVGWLVRVTDGDVILAWKASSPRFEVYRDPDARHNFIERSVGRIGGFVN